MHVTPILSIFPGFSRQDERHLSFFPPLFLWKEQGWMEGQTAFGDYIYICFG
jgi:hypothetical protein